MLHKRTEREHKYFTDVLLDNASAKRSDRWRGWPFQRKLMAYIVIPNLKIEEKIRVNDPQGINFFVRSWWHKTEMVASFPRFNVFGAWANLGQPKPWNWWAGSQPLTFTEHAWLIVKSHVIFLVSNPWYLEPICYNMLYHGKTWVFKPSKAPPPQAPSFLIIIGSEMLRVFKGPKLETTAGPLSLKTSAMAGATRS